MALRDNRKFERFLVWYSLPELLKGMSGEEIQIKYGIKDPEALELFQFRTQKAIAKDLNIHPDTLTDWVKIIKEQRLDRAYRKTDLFRGTTANVVAALYKKAVETGNRQEVEYYLDYVGEHQTSLSADDQEAKKQERDYETLKKELEAEEAAAKDIAKRIAEARSRTRGQAGKDIRAKAERNQPAGKRANRQTKVRTTPPRG